eukprot:1329421-Amphidinium_carterae.1
MFFLAPFANSAQRFGFASRDVLGLKEPLGIEADSLNSCSECIPKELELRVAQPDTFIHAFSQMSVVIESTFHPNIGQL